MHAIRLVVLSVLLGVGMLFTLVSASTQQTKLLSDRKLELEVAKLQQEVDLLEREQRYSGARLWLSVFGGLLGGATLVWTVVAGLRSFTHRTNEQRLSRIAGLLENLSADSDAARLGAARALKLYADDTFGELLAAAETERFLPAREAIVAALASGNAQTLRTVWDANADTLPHRAFLLGRLAAEKDQDPVALASLAGLTPKATRSILRRYRAHYQHGKRSNTLPLDPAAKDVEEQFSEGLAHTLRLVDTTRSVISKVLRDHRVLPFVRMELDLSEANLYRVQLSDCQVEYSLLRTAILRHAKLTNVHFHGAELWGVDLFDAKVVSCQFTKCCLTEAHWRESRIERSAFAETDLRNAVLSSSKILQTSFTNSQLEAAAFRGSEIVDCNLESCPLHGSQMQGSQILHCELGGAQLFRASLKGAYFENVKLRGAKFNGADLSSCSFHRCDLRDVDFAGADISHAKFVNSMLDNMAFEHCRNSGTASVDEGKA